MKSFFPSPLRSFLPLLVLALPAFGAADYATPYVFGTFAGTSSIGSADGTGAAARFFSPQDLATDSTGNIFVVDEGNHTIRKVTPEGVVTTFAGTAGIPGSANGTGTAARFDSPQNIVTDATDNLFVTDTGNHTIRKITPAGVVTTLAGLAGVTGNINGTGSAARFNRPRGIAVDKDGNLYVTEGGNHTVRKITPAGVVSTFAENLAFNDNPPFPETADLHAATPLAYGAIAVDSAGNIYVSRFDFESAYTGGPSISDYYRSYYGRVTLITPVGIRTDLWTTYAYAYFDGRLANHFVSALVIDASNRLVLTDGTRIVRYDPASSSLTSFTGSGLLGSADGPPESARFGFAPRLAYNHTSTLYVADTGNNNLRTVRSSTGTVTTLAGLALEVASGNTDGTGAAARFNNPAGTAVDATGTVYVADASTHCIRKISPTGVVTTLAGSPELPGSADGTGTAARFLNPTGVAVDSAGNVFVADTGNHTIRRITPTGETSTIAGLATATGWFDGQGSAARFTSPRGIAIDPAGNLYVTSAETVRKIDPAANVTTLAGLTDQTGYVDATGSAARFAFPYGIAVDASGNVYVSEAPDNPASARIRKITSAGVVTTVAGSDHGYADGSATAARFHNPRGLARDAAGNLFVTDTHNQVVRKISPSGTITTVAGLADAPGSADGTGRDARFYYPQGIAVDAAGTLYVTSGTTVHKGLLATLPVISTQPQGASVQAGANVSFSVTAAGTPTPTYQWQVNGSALAGATGSSLSLGVVSSASAGDYTVVVTNALGSVTSAKATLTVTAAPVTPLPPVSSGGGGGGAPSVWFLAALLALGLVRRRQGRP